MITRILVALDGSPRAPGVFDAAARMGAPFGATLYPLRAIFIPPEFPAAGAGSRADPLPGHLARVALEELLVLAAHPAHATIRVDIPRVRVGEPWRVIVDTSDELEVDLIVIGSHGYHVIDRILGTTAARVANLAHRNVLVVHERAGRSSGVGSFESPYRRGDTG